VRGTISSAPANGSGSANAPLTNQLILTAHVGGQLIGTAQRVAGLPAGLAPSLDLAQDQQAAGMLWAKRRQRVRRDRRPRMIRRGVKVVGCGGEGVDPRGIACRGGTVEPQADLPQTGGDPPGLIQPPEGDVRLGQQVIHPAAKSGIGPLALVRAPRGQLEMPHGGNGVAAPRAHLAAYAGTEASRGLRLGFVVGKALVGEAGCLVQLPGRDQQLAPQRRHWAVGVLQAG
jgi:hypothetical protein